MSTSNGSNGSDDNHVNLLEESIFKNSTQHLAEKIYKEKYKYFGLETDEEEVKAVRSCSRELDFLNVLSSGYKYRTLKIKYEGWTPLQICISVNEQHFPILIGQIEMITSEPDRNRLLIQKTPEGWNALMLAVSTKKIELIVPVLRLIDGFCQHKVAPFRGLDKDNNNALMLGAFYGHHIADLVLQSLISIENEQEKFSILSQKNFKGETIFTIAAKYQQHMLPTLIKTIEDFHEPDNKTSILKSTNHKGHNLLSLLLKDKNIECIQQCLFILFTLSESDVKEILEVIFVKSMDVVQLLNGQHENMNSLNLLASKCGIDKEWPTRANQFSFKLPFWRGQRKQDKVIDIAFNERASEERDHLLQL